MKKYAYIKNLQICMSLYHKHLLYLVAVSTIMYSIDYYTKTHTNMQALFLLKLNPKFSITATFAYKQINLKKE